MMFQPSKEHLADVREVEKCVKKWKPRLLWLRNWDITVVPIPGQDGEDEAFIQIACASYVPSARIEVREGLSTSEHLQKYLGEEFSVELATVHELCHLLLDEMQGLFLNWVETDTGLPRAALGSFRDLDEKAVWSLSRTLIELDRA